MVLNPEQKTSFLPTQLLTLHRTSAETVRDDTKPSQRTGFPGPTPPQQPPDTPALLLRNGRGKGGRARGCPPQGLLGLVAGGESALPASPHPYRPGLEHHHRTAQGFLRRSAEAAQRAAHLPAHLPRGARSSGQRPRCHRAAPRTPELRRAASPPPPLCSAASRRRPRANFSGEEEATRD